MEEAIPNESAFQRHNGSSSIHDRALDQVFKTNASLCRRILTLEHREGCLKSQLKLQKRALATITDEAAGAWRLVAIAED